MEPLESASTQLDLGIDESDLRVNNLDFQQIVDWEASVLAVDILSMVRLEVYKPAHSATYLDFTARSDAHERDAELVVRRTDASITVVELTMESILSDLLYPWFRFVRELCLKEVDVLHVTVLQLHIDVFVHLAQLVRRHLEGLIDLG